MSNVDLIRGIYDAFARLDIQAVMEALHPGIEWVEPELDGLGYGGAHSGSEAVLMDVFAKVPQTWEHFELRPERYVDGGDSVVAVGEVSVRGPGGEATFPFAHVWDVRDGKGARMQVFVDTLAARRALGEP